MPSRGSALFVLSSALLAACASFGVSEPPATEQEAGVDAGAADDGAAAKNEAGAPGVPDPCFGGAAPSCPVGAWDFDEQDGAKLVDRSGHGADGTLGVANRVAGKRGGALAFSRSASSRQAGVPTQAQTPLDIGGTALSIAFWVWLDELSEPTADEVLLGKPWTTNLLDPPWYQYGVEWDANGTKDLQLYLGNADASYVVGSVEPLYSRWTHIAFVYDGNAIVAFRDGVETRVTRGAATLSRRGTPLHFGNDPVMAQPFGGKLDEVRIYDRALTPAEVATLAGP